MTDIVERLRGIYRVPIKDSLGPVGGCEPNNPTEFVRKFETPPIQREAADEIERLAKKRDDVLRQSRETFEAMVAMRNDINEYVPLPSLESDLSQGAEDGVFCTVVAQSVVAHVTALNAELSGARTEIQRLTRERDEARTDAIQAGWKSAHDCVAYCAANWRQDCRTKADHDALDGISRLLEDMRRNSPDDFLDEEWKGAEDAAKAERERDEARRERDEARAQALEEAARVAEGPEYARDGRGEVNLRGTGAGNWSVPTSRFPRVRDYGQGRHDAAAAIRALAKKETGQ